MDSPTQLEAFSGSLPAGVEVPTPAALDLRLPHRHLPHSSQVARQHLETRRTSQGDQSWAGRIVALDVLVVEDSRVSLRPGDQLPSCHPLQKQAEGKHSGHPRFWRFSTNMAFHRCPIENLGGFSPDTSQVTSGHIAMFNVSQHLRWADTWSTYSHYPSSANQ